MNEDLQKILSRVRDLYTKYGIKSITMDDVARELCMSKKTLYQFVTDKDDLVGKFVDNEIDLRKESIATCFKPGSNAIEDLFEISLFMNKLMIDHSPATEYDLKKYYAHHYEKIVTAREEGISNYILLNLKKGKMEGFYRDEINESIIAKLYMSRFENARFNDLFTVEEYASFKLFMELLTYHIRGIATKKGITVFEKKLNELEKINK
jgi:TetR/AcrR family transcriptional regulator, cholesterol catabolism regulator